MGSEMMVQKIRQGIVVDHIKAGIGLAILEMLAGDLKGRAVLLHNAFSRKLGRKDVLKIEFGLSDGRELQLISLFSPGATLNWIEDWEVVRKEKVEPPEFVEGMLRCPNPKCISNDPIEKRFLKSRFRLEGDSYFCVYCGASINRNSVSEHVIV